MSIDVWSENDKISVIYRCDAADSDGFDVCDRQVIGTKRMLSQPPTDWWVGTEYGTLRTYCMVHKPTVKR